MPSAPLGNNPIPTLPPSGGIAAHAVAPPEQQQQHLSLQHDAVHLSSNAAASEQKQRAYQASIEPVPTRARRPDNVQPAAQLFVKTLTGRTITLDVSPGDTILSVKRAVRLKEGIPEGDQRLIYGGKQMEDDRVLRNFGAFADITLHLAARLRGGTGETASETVDQPNVPHSRKLTPEAALRAQQEIFTELRAACASFEADGAQSQEKLQLLFDQLATLQEAVANAHPDACQVCYATIVPLNERVCTCAYVACKRCIGQSTKLNCPGCQKITPQTLASIANDSMPLNLTTMCVYGWGAFKPQVVAARRKRQAALVAKEGAELEAEEQTEEKEEAEEEEEEAEDDEEDEAYKEEGEMAPSTRETRSKRPREEGAAADGSSISSTYGEAPATNRQRTESSLGSIVDAVDKARIQNSPEQKAPEQKAPEQKAKEKKKREEKIDVEIRQALEHCWKRGDQCSYRELMSALGAQLDWSRGKLDTQPAGGMDVATIQNQWYIMEGMETSSAEMRQLSRLRKGELCERLTILANAQELELVDETGHAGHVSSAWEYLCAKFKYGKHVEAYVRSCHQFFLVWKVFHPILAIISSKTPSWSWMQTALTKKKLLEAVQKFKADHPIEQPLVIRAPVLPLPEGLRDAPPPALAGAVVLVQDSWYNATFLKDPSDIMARVQNEAQFILRTDLDRFEIFGKEVVLPRDKAFYGDVEADGSHPVYRYGDGDKFAVVKPWTPVLEWLRDEITRLTGQKCNHLVLNRYNDGADHIGYHHDKICDFVDSTHVFTISLGSTRKFRIQEGDATVAEVDLAHGSLTCLGWETNKTHRHAIIKASTNSVPGVRYGLTFRTMKTSSREFAVSAAEGVPSGRIALTFGERAESRAGGPMVGDAIAAAGFSVAELRQIAAKFQNATVISLHGVLAADLQSSNEAAVLLIKGGVQQLGVDPAALLAEQGSIKYDKMAYRARFKDTVNSIARHNIVFGPERVEHSEDYKQNTVASWAEVPLLAQVRAALSKWGPKATDLNAEGNHYYDSSKCGIGFHGDAERKIVVCASLGKSATLRFIWKAPRNDGPGQNPAPFDVQLEHGDIYVMSEKATGWDARKHSQWRLMHAAGASSFIKL